jgi:hypothetical protein
MEAANNAAQNREIQELEPEKTTEQAEAETT